jgi:hypothetical protein
MNHFLEDAMSGMGFAMVGGFLFESHGVAIAFVLTACIAHGLVTGYIRAKKELS